MKIEPISNGNLRIWLAEDEIEAWGLEEGQGVRRLVRRALAAVGRRPSAHIGADMIPVEGGCVVLVSPIAFSRLPIVYEVDAKDLQDVCIRWPRLSENTAQIYAMEDGYRIVAYRDDAEYLLREYGYPIGWGDGVAAHAAEYGELFTVLAPVPPEHEDRDR